MNLVPSTCRVPIEGAEHIMGATIKVRARSQASFLASYHDVLRARYVWAQDDSKLALYMLSVKRTIEGPEKTWNHDGEAVTATWRIMGGKGTPSLKALRALPRV